MRRRPSRRQLLGFALSGLGLLIGTGAGRAAGAGPIEALADELSARLAAELAPPHGELLALHEDRAIIAIPGLSPGDELEWLSSAQELLEALAASQGVGAELLRPCGSVRVREAGGGRALGTLHREPGCPPPEPGAKLRLRSGPIALVLRRGNVEPALEGLLDLLLRVLPSRLEQSGIFSRISTTTGPLSGRAPQAVALLSLARQAGRIETLVELKAGPPREDQTLFQVSMPVVPEALWRRPQTTSDALPERAQLSIPGPPAMALASVDRDADGQDELLVLTSDALLSVALDPEGLLVSSRLVDLRALAPALVPTRLAGGTLVAAGSGGRFRACFATTGLRSGWCLGPGILEPIPGVPLAGPDPLLLSEWIPGTNQLRGALHALHGESKPVAPGPIVGFAREPEGTLLVRLADGRLVRVDPALASPAVALGAGGGDALLALSSQLRIQTLASLPGQPDALRLDDGATAAAPRPLPGAIRALARSDLDGDGQPELAVLSCVQEAACRLSIHPLHALVASPALPQAN